MTLKYDKYERKNKCDYFYFWDVRCVSPILTMPADTTFEIRYFKMRLVLRTSEYDTQAWRPNLSDIQDQHLVAQFAVHPACRPEDLGRDYWKLIKKMAVKDLVEAEPQYAFSAPRARRVYMQEFLNRCHVIANERPPERSRQPEENAHIKPKAKAAFSQ